MHKKIVDGAGNSISCTYGGNGYSDLTLSSVQSPDGTTSFDYTNGNLTKITFKDGTSMSFTYSAYSEYRRLSSVTDRNGVKILYGYETSGALRKRMRVKTITEQADGITGRITNIDYSKHNCTTFTYTTFVGTLSETYQFSDWGHTTCVVAADGSTSNIRYNEFSGNDTRRNLAKNHTISEVSSSIRYINNLLVNHSVENGTTGWHTFQQESTDVSFARDTDQKFLGNYSLQVYQDESTSGKAGWYQWANITGGKGYTFSAYVKTNGVSATTGNGATLYLLAYNEEGTLLERKECEIKLTGNNDWQRLSLAYTAPAEATSLQLAAGLWNASGTAWFDCFQFESGVSPNAYNILENSDFSANTKWTGRYTESNDGIVSSGMVKLVGDPEIKKDFYQSIKIGKAGVAFTMSAKAKAPACPVESLENRAFAIAVGIIYDDGTGEPCYIQFNPDVDQWQTMSFTAAPKKENWGKVIDHVNIYVIYYNQENTAFFDDIMVTLDETGTAYTYDDEGNLITSSDNAAHQTSYDIDSATNLVQEMTDSTNTVYSYTYDTTNPRKLVTAKENSTSTGYVYTYGTGNNSGNVTSVTMGTITEQNEVKGSDSYIKTETSYTSNGAFVQSETDQRGNEVNYSLNATTGRINVVTDPLNNKTGYVYDDTTQYLCRVNAWNSSDQIVSSVWYEYFGPEYGGLLRKIQLGENYYYNFVYNAWADQQSVRINNTRELVYHSYNSNNGSLKKSTYGNGQSVEYIYDDYGRLSGEKVTNTSGGTAVQTSAYVYDALGRLSREKDYVNGHTSIYQYDIAGRLTRQINGQGSFLYSYDNLNRPDRMSFTFDGQSYLTTYDYLSANRPNRTDLVVGRVERTYDNLQRETSHRVYSSDEGTTYLETTTAFIGVDGNRTTQLPRIYTTLRTDGENSTRPGGYTGFTYAYDANGNITAINETNGSDSRTKTYTYDALNRLKTETDPVTGNATTYTYDARGNILSKKISGGSSSTTVTYTYGDSTWKDLLTAYNGEAITYDAIGNPISYLGNTFTWQQGRQLASATTANGQTVTYRYNTDGIRIGKTVNGVNTEYLVDTAGAIHAMKQGNHTLIFMYDSTGRREGFVCYSDTYGDVAYYYLYNAQGDVIGLTDGSLNTVVQYTYNAWGKLISTTGSKANTIGKLNPFRYRGYVHDEETELYYIQARYYDPEVGRWISAEPNVYAGAFDSGAGISAYNTFAYCGNNPVINFDPTGEFILTALIVGVVAGAVIGGAIGGTAAYKSAKSTGAEGSELFTETLKGVGTGAVVGGVIGGMAGATAGVAMAYGAASFAGTTMITTTATMAAKTMEVTTLQIKKSSNDGDNGWQTANDCINSVFNNGHKIAGITPFTKSTGFSVNHALNSMIERDFGGKQTIFDTMGSPGGKLAYAGVAYAGCNVFRAVICNDPCERARVRGYTLE